MTLDDDELRKLAAADLAAHPHLPRPVSADPLIELLSDHSPPEPAAAGDANADLPAASDSPPILPPLPAAPPLDFAGPGSSASPPFPLPLLPGAAPDPAFQSNPQPPLFDSSPPDLIPGEAFEHPVARPGPPVASPFINIDGLADDMPGGPVPPSGAQSPASPQLPPFPLLVHIDPPADTDESTAGAGSASPGFSGHAPPSVRLERDHGSSPDGAFGGGGAPVGPSGSAGSSPAAPPPPPIVIVEVGDRGKVNREAVRAIAGELSKRVEQALQDLRRRMDHYQAQRAAMYRDR